MVMRNERFVVAITLTTFLVSSCASTQIKMGRVAFNQGNYGLAAHMWNQLAREGNPVAENNIGVLWEHGLGKTPKNLYQAATWFLKAARQGNLQAMTNLAYVQKELGHEEAATSWLMLAARWGYPQAKKMLQAWGEPVPDPDLLQQHQLAEQEKREQQAVEEQRRDEEIGNAMGNAIGLVLLFGLPAIAHTSGNPTIPPSPSVAPLPAVAPFANSSAPSSGCTSDFNCQMGFKCVKYPYMSSGVCMQMVNQNDLPVLPAPTTIKTGPNSGHACYSDADCPVGLRCDPGLEACVK